MRFFSHSPEIISDFPSVPQHYDPARRETQKVFNVVLALEAKSKKKFKEREKFMAQRRSQTQRQRKRRERQEKGESKDDDENDDDVNLAGEFDDKGNLFPSAQSAFLAKKEEKAALKYSWIKPLLTKLSRVPHTAAKCRIFHNSGRKREKNNTLRQN